MSALRTATKQRGRPFRPGQSGNPGGRPKGYGEIREIARQYTAEAIETLAAIMRTENAQPAARIAAATAILDRGWGRPTQPVAGDAEDSKPFIFMVNPVDAKL